LTRRIVALLGGATGTGKTEAALEWARRRGWEILSCDSGQARTGLSVGTAAPTELERAEVFHHHVGVLDPRQPDSVGMFLKRVQPLLATEGPDLLAVGGTGQYLSGLRDGLEASPGTDPALRALLESRLREEGRDALHEELRQRVSDPPHDALANPVRLVRALEKAILRERGEVGEAIPAPAPGVPAFALTRPRESLHLRLAARLDLMLRGGWREEVARLATSGLTPSDPGLRAIGYAALWEVKDLPEIPAAVRERILSDTRAYARRQETWLRTRLKAVFVEAESAAAATADRLDALWSEHVGPGGRLPGDASP
jgi:tRNA dimethylallyltransferase